MSTDLFDLGQRLRAAVERRPVPASLYAPALPPTRPVAVAAHADGTIAATDGTRTLTGDVLPVLAALGVSTDDPVHRTLVLPTRATWSALDAATRTTRTPTTTSTGTGTERAVTATIAWWRARADHPGTGAVLIATDAASARYRLGVAPPAERDLSVWAHWLALPTPHPDDPASTASTALDLARVVTSGHTLPGLLDVHTADTASWDYHRQRIASGWDVHHRDSRREAALGLATRCHAAELYASMRLADPLVARRAVHDGTLVTATITAITTAPGQRTMSLRAAQPLSRLRTGNRVQGWAGHASDTTTAHRDASTPVLRSATVADVRIDAAGHLVLDLADVTTGRHPFTVGDTITVRARAVDPHQQRSARTNLGRRYRAHNNWLNRDTPPPTRRRPVPLDVVIAAAD